MLAAFAVLLAANAGALMAGEAAAQGLRIRGLHHLYQAGRHLAAALVVVGVIALISWSGRFGRRRGVARRTS